MNYPVVDFRKPVKIPDDIGRMLVGWQLRAREDIEVRLSRNMSGSVKAEFEEPTPLTGAELRALADTTISYRTELSDKSEPSLLIFDRLIALALLHEVMGQELEALPEDREITRIESAGLDFIADELCRALQTAMKRSTTRVRQLGTVALRELHSEFPLEVSNSQIVLRLTLPYGEGLVRWVLPQSLSLDLVAALPKAPEADAATRQMLKENVLSAPAELRILLGQASVPLQSLRNLVPGDLIVLDQKISESLTAEFGGQTLFKGWPGQSGKKQMFQIDELVLA